MGYHRTCCPTIPSLHGDETHVNKYLRAGTGTNGKLMDFFGRDIHCMFPRRGA